MKPFTIVLVALLSATTVFCQTDTVNKSRRHHPILTPPPGRENSTKLAPLRGRKDLRPKQFPVISQSAFANVDLSPTLKNMQKLQVGGRTAFPVASLTPLSAVLVRRNLGSTASSFSFRVENDTYKGAFIFINIVKDRLTGQPKYSGHMIRPGYSDVLKLKSEDGRMYFVVEAHENVVQD